MVFNATEFMTKWISAFQVNLFKMFGRVPFTIFVFKQTVWPELTSAKAVDTISKFLTCKKVEQKDQFDTLANEVKKSADAISSMK